jgi:hypothetical protein
LGQCPCQAVLVEAAVVGGEMSRHEQEVLCIVGQRNRIGPRREGCVDIGSAREAGTLQRRGDGVGAGGQQEALMDAVR